MKHISYTTVARGNLGFPTYNCGGSIADAVNAYVKEVAEISAAVRLAERNYGTIFPVVAPAGNIRTWDESIQDEPSVGMKMLMFNTTERSTRCVRM